MSDLISAHIPRLFGNCDDERIDAAAGKSYGDYAVGGHIFAIIVCSTSNTVVWSAEVVEGDVLGGASSVESHTDDAIFFSDEDIGAFVGSYGGVSIGVEHVFAIGGVDGGFVFADGAVFVDIG